MLMSPRKESAQKVTEITKSQKSKIRRDHLTAESSCQNLIFDDALMHWREPYVKSEGPVVPLSKVTASRALKRFVTSPA
jgi:hypothetical protein